VYKGAEKFFGGGGEKSLHILFYCKIKDKTKKETNRKNKKKKGTKGGVNKTHLKKESWAGVGRREKKNSRMGRS